MYYISSACLDRGCSTVVEPTPHHQEAVGSNPAGCWFFSTFLHQRSEVTLIRSLEEVHLLLRGVKAIKWRPSCAAWLCKLRLGYTELYQQIAFLGLFLVPIQ